MPHDALDSEAYASQVPVVPPLQQPLGQLLASHAQRPSVVSHTPFEHALHAAPPAPHSDDDCPVYRTHLLPLQQPPGQETESHTHCPVVALHSWPVPQALQAAPPVPHDVAVSDA